MELFGITSRADLLKKSPWLLHLIGDEAARHCCPLTGNGGLIWCLSSCPQYLVGLSIQDEAIDVVQSALHEKEEKKIGFIYEENHKFSADDKM